MWEDESIELKLRDMRISEGCLMTTLKSMNFEAEYRANQDAMELGRLKVEVSEAQVVG